MLPPKRRINYSQVMQQVSGIKTLSNDTNRASHNLDDTVIDIKKIWSGDASNGFKTQCGTMIVSIEGTAKKISDLANKVAEAAQDIKREDDEAQRRYEEHCREERRKEEQRKQEAKR